MKEYIERLVQLREEKGMSVTECARLLDIDAQFLTMIELGEIIPTPQQCEKIANFIIENLGS